MLNQVRLEPLLLALGDEGVEQMDVHDARRLLVELLGDII